MPGIKNISKHSPRPVASRMPFSIITRRDIAIGAIVLSLVILFIQLSSLNTSLKPPGPKMGVTHVVFFQFNSSASPGVINDISRRMLALKDSCIHPTSKKPYIKSASGGTDISPEGLQNGITHAFVIEFESAEDRDYYVNNDPAHNEFKKLAAKVLERAQVIDFIDGVFKL